MTDQPNETPTEDAPDVGTERVGADTPPDTSIYPGGSETPVITDPAAAEGVTVSNVKAPADMTDAERWNVLVERLGFPDLVRETDDE
jgi:hypothetical protein